MHSCRLGIIGALAFGFAVAGSTATAQASVILADDVNGSEIPGFFVYATGLNNIGWEYTPTTSYLLCGIESTFRSIPAPPVATRTVSLSIYDSVSDAQLGNAPLRTGSFSAGAAGGDLGITFADLMLTGGHNYFVAFSGTPGVEGLGLNIVDFDVSLPPPQPAVPPFNLNPAIDFLSGWYTGANFTTFNSQFDSPGFAAPILRFSSPIAVPEPGTFALTAGLAALGLVLRLRRRRVDPKAA
ncbi:MAG: PEP-CTERM sorting domain-containing protein [Planctomycetaceae bacterium]